MVPHDLAVVVVAVQAEWLPDPFVSLAVPVWAGQRFAVGPDGPVSAGPARLGHAGAAVCYAAVYGAEGFGGEGGEHGQVSGDGLGRRSIHDGSVPRSPAGRAPSVLHGVHA